MNIFSALWDGLQDILETILRLYEGLLEPITGLYAWGLSIILLTLTVRLFLVPLAVRQTKSMRAMQQLQPELKKLQKKYEVDRSMMRTDPERYKAMKEKQREAQAALFQEHGVNPAGGCLPLILQMPIFFALFRILQPGAGLGPYFSDLINSVPNLEPVGAGTRLPELVDAPFFGITNLADTAAAGAGIGAIVLVLLQIATTYYSTRQMQGRNTQSAPEQQQAQKMMMYIMPAFLGFLSWSFPIGVVLYWVTTNFWTIGQQSLIFKRVEAEEAAAAEERAKANAERKRTPKGDGTPRKRRPADEQGSSKGGSSKGNGSPKGSGSSKGSSSKGSSSRTSSNGRASNGNGRNGAARNGGTSNGRAKGSPGKGGRSGKGGSAGDGSSARSSSSSD